MQRTDELVAQAKQMAEEFAEMRGADILRQFLVDSSLGKDLYKSYLESGPNTDCGEERFFDLLVEDYKYPFAAAMALSYVFGYLDEKEKAPRKLYKKPKAKPKKEEPFHPQLVFPGLKD